MPAEINTSPLHDEFLPESHDKFEWHIKVTEHAKLTEGEASTGSSSAISLLDEHAQKQASNLSKSDLKKAVMQGALWLTPAKNRKQTQRLRRLKKVLSVGDELHFYYNKKVLDTEVPEALLIKDLIDYSVWYKPYGMLSQGSKWSDHCSIARFAQKNLPSDRPAFIVHRLDKAATGLILIAHTKKAAQALSKMFEQHQLEKYYHIIVHGDHQQRPQPDVIIGDIDDKKSRSTFTCLDYDEVSKRSLVKVKIDSGRKHQIRKHAASIGMPVVGDRLHGIADDTESLDLQLCAVSLSFNCPLVQSSTVSDDEKAHTDNIRFFELPETLKPQL